MREGTPKATGFVNNIKVRCKKCGTTQYLKPGPGSWKCTSCKATN